MTGYPTDIYMYDSHRIIHRGHGLDAAALVADFREAVGPHPDELIATKEVHLRFQPRVKFCGNHGDACDSEGEWHSHWHGVQRNDDPDTKFTLVGVWR